MVRYSLCFNHETQHFDLLFYIEKTDVKADQNIKSLLTEEADKT